MNRNQIEQLLVKIRDKKMCKSDIENILLIASDKYYNSDSPILSDSEFDEVKNVYETEYEGSLKIGSKPASDLLNVMHSDEDLMGSLTNVYSIEEVRKWVKTKINSLKNNKSINIFTSIKYDGCSVALDVLKNGKVLRAYTRGQDGLGLDVTKLFNGISFKPHDIDSRTDIVTIRCECIMTWKDFAKFSKEYEKNEGKTPANPRTSVSGIFSKKTGDVYKKYLTLVLLDHNGKHIKNRIERIRDLMDLNEINNKFNDHDNPRVFNPGAFVLEGVECKNVESISEFYDEFSKKRDSETLPFMADGVVIEFIDEDVKKSLGSRTSDGKNLPSWAAALKMKAKEFPTVLENVEFDLSNSTKGIVTPVAMIKPVTIDGKTYKRVSLANLNRLISEDFKIGGKIILSIRGDVLGYVERCPGVQEEEKHLPSVKIPDKCSTCNSELVISDNGVWLSCVNNECTSKQTGKILNYVKKMKIKGIAEAMVNELVEKEYITDIFSLYELFLSPDQEDKREALKLESGWGERSVEKCIKTLQSRLKVKDYEFLGSLGWNNVGRTMMEKINKVYTINDMYGFCLSSVNPNNLRDHLIDIKGVGNEMSESISENIINDIQMITDLTTKYINLIETKQKEEEELDMTKYITFTENNDNEGESWNFYIPINLPGLEILKNYVKACNKTDIECYDIDNEELDETFVNTICRKTKSGYMDYHNKVKAIEYIDVMETNIKSKNYDDDPLYKGQAFVCDRNFKSMTKRVEDTELQEIVITGKFENHTREEFKTMIEDTAGFKFASSITKNTKYLLMADKNSTSSKAKTAKKSGITIIDENGLYELLGLEIEV